MTTKHTPAPWAIVECELWDISVVDGSGGVICHINNKGKWFPQPDSSTAGRSHNKMLEHARLIAAAPDLDDLAESLGRVNAVAKRGKDGRVFIDCRDWEALMSQQRATLAKARGEG